MRRRRVLTTVGTVTTLGIAGCLGDDQSDPEPEDEESTDDDAESTDDDAESADDDGPSLEEFSFPEHATREQLDASEFAAAHFETVRSAGSVTVSGSRTYDGEHQMESSFEIKLSSDGVLASHTDGGVDETTWAELGGSRGFVERSTGFRTEYQITPEVPRADMLLRRSMVESFVRAFEFTEAMDAVEIDGTVTARYDIADVADSSRIGAVIRRGDVDVQDVAGSIFITEDGELKRTSHDIDFENRGERANVTGELTYGSIGETTTAEPDWVATAREEGRAFRSTVTDDGFVEFELVNGTSIPKGSRLRVYAHGGNDGERTLRTDISVGDRVVVASSDSGLSIGINERPTATSEFTGRYVNLRIRDQEILLYEGGRDL